MRVLKFGGSSVASPDRILQISNILKGYYEEGIQFTVVFSAFGGVTDSLIEMSDVAAGGDRNYESLLNSFSSRHKEATQSLFNNGSLKGTLEALDENHKVLKDLLHGIYLVKELTPRSKDYVLSFGERNSAYIIAHMLREMGINTTYLDARKVIVTDESFGSAKVDFEATNKKISDFYESHPGVKIVTGFVASSETGLTTTLGRGGSDYTASIFGAALDSEHIEIWTDVNGVLTCDPRKVKKAFTIPSLSYAEAMEMSHFGAKVIYPPTLVPAMNKSIPIYIKNTFQPEFEGTLISKDSSNGNAVKGISSISSIALLTLHGSGLFGVPGIAARLFSSLAAAKINVILITQGSSESSISFAVRPEEAKLAKNCVDKAFEYERSLDYIEEVLVENKLSVVAVIGEHMKSQPGIAGRLFQALGKNGINIVAIAQGSSELNVSVVIGAKDETKALNVLHQALFLSNTREINLFMVGVGLIGSTLIDQIKAQADFLKSQRSIEVKVVGLANSKKMYFAEDGIPLDSWKEALDASEEGMQMNAFVERIKSLNLSNSIFLDNTANPKIADFYESILDASISISTPNKIATSSSYLQYNRLKNIAAKRGVHFMYETNVGAGLPVISTLRDLINSGDRIIKLEAVLSGTLSYIFNNFKGDVTFHDVVKRASELGLTEPDPRTDLNGIDVKRKIVILAREIGLSIEADDVKIQSVLPEACKKSSSVDELFETLKEQNQHFENLKADASSKDKVLRMVALLENGKAEIKLMEIGQDHAFYSLSGSDNMISFTTARYKDRPLVIRGPGAGAEVTAAGVFAEVLTIGNLISN